MTEAIQDAFKSFDADKSGTLDTVELVAAFASMVSVGSRGRSSRGKWTERGKRSDT